MSGKSAPATGPTELDVFACPLTGTGLIEASAGTGKTWNICALYLRLLLERGLAVQNILVVTFTNAATAELRDRIRSRIADTLAWLRARARGESPDDPFASELTAAAARHADLSPERMLLTLDLALQYFDEAAIFTIHGFCQRALADASFSAGLPFALELVPDDSDMRQEAVNDFWRNRIAAATCPPDLAAWLLQQGDTPDKHAELLKRSLGKPLAMHLWPPAVNAPAPVAAAGGLAVDTAVDTADVVAAYAKARAAWAASRDAILAAVGAALPGLHGSYYKDATIERATIEWDDWFRQDQPLAPLPEGHKLDLFAAATLQKRTKKGRTTPIHPFFDQADALLMARAAVTDALADARLRLIRDLIKTAGDDLRQRKRDRRVLAFDDMLYNLYAALTGGERPWLAESLRQRFPAALIDEFQDTDPLQFAIFDAIYGGSDAPVFLVGDPKQAIYSFRNADLHAYLRARGKADFDYTLGANQRSTESLIEALNGLFSAKSGAFMLDGLDYHRVAMGRKQRLPFRDDSAPRADLQLWLLPAGEDGSVPHKRDAKALAVRATAAEIARLLAESRQGRIVIGDRALQPGDVAVLVRTHAQGSDLKRELATLDVGSVELSQASVFASIDAEEVERVLIAINDPSRETLLRGALATEMLGCDAGTITEISASEEALMGCLERFAAYRDVWLRRGVGVMFRRLLAHERVTARMLARDDGERRLTNLLHLGEQLHQASTQYASPDALLRWLQAQRRDGSADEIAQLRLESDRNLVQIITIHKAKGLEFPVVFCPFLWDGRTRFGGHDPEGREYHNDEGNAVIDFRDDDALGDEADRIKSQIHLEQAAESLRLAYVALTRAVYRCYLIAGTYATGGGRGLSVTEATRSVLNWLVAGEGDTPAVWFDARRTPQEIAAAWTAFATANAPHVGLAPLPLSRGIPVARSGPAPESLSALPPPEAIPAAWRIGSFSSLASGAHSESAATDHDGRIADAAPRRAEAPATIAADDILRFPRGPSAGDCLHALFERIEFTDATRWGGAIAAALAAHPQTLPGARAAGASAQLMARMAGRMLADVMATTLPAGIVLGAIPATRRLTELEFNLPAPRVSASTLNAVLKRDGYDVPRLGFRDLEGYLKGYIDLVFEHDGRYYVLDWKSNHLGYAASDYGPVALAEAMAEHSYHLQYLLYSLALERYLRHRLPDYRHDAHFGGVLYLFVRGVRPEWRNDDGSPTGVHFHRPATATLARLDALFAPALETVTP